MLALKYAETGGNPPAEPDRLAIAGVGLGGSALRSWAIGASRRVERAALATSSERPCACDVWDHHSRQRQGATRSATERPSSRRIRSRLNDPSSVLNNVDTKRPRSVPICAPRRLNGYAQVEL